MWDWTKKVAGHAWRMAGEFATSKKAVATVASILVFASGHLGFEIDPGLADRIAGALLLWVGAQAHVDAAEKKANKELTEAKATLAKLLNESSR